MSVWSIFWRSKKQKRRGVTEVLVPEREVDIEQLLGQPYAAEPESAVAAATPAAEPDTVTAETAVVANNAVAPTAAESVFTTATPAAPAQTDLDAQTAVVLPQHTLQPAPKTSTPAAQDTVHTSVIAAAAAKPISENAQHGIKPAASLAAQQSVNAAPSAQLKHVAEDILTTPDFSDIHEEWRQEAATIGGVSPLLHFDDAPENRIDLLTTHPSGVAQFIAGHKILLSSLIRDEEALRKSRRAAGRVTDKAIEMRNMRGLETVQLGSGIAKWSFEGSNYCAPVLLSPLAIRRYGRDYEIKLKDQLAVNPELIAALRAQYGITLNAQVLLELAQAGGVFNPQPVVNRLQQMTAGIRDFKVEMRLVVSSFYSVAGQMRQDLMGLDTPILRAVCGDQKAIKQLRAAYRPVSAPSLDTRAPETDTALYDVDSEQDDVISQVAAGQSLVVQTMPGTGGTQTVVNAIAEQVRAGKRVLVVSPRTATLDGISHRLDRAGLLGLVTSVRKLRRNLVEAITRNERAKPQSTGDIEQALVRLRGVLADYRQALGATDSELGISPLTAVRELTKLSMLENAPQTTVRLTPKALKLLALDRTSTADALVEVARLGQFQYGPDDSPWYGVTFSSTEEARGAYARAVDISETKLPRLHTLAQELLGQTPLEPYKTIDQLGAYLRLFAGIGKTLDTFQPAVYDRSLTEVIAAHAPRSANDTMTSANRRRLKKLAREYVRPGVTVTDMYQQLVAIQQQREQWKLYCTVDGAMPQLPVGLGEVYNIYQAVSDDLSALDKVLGTANDSEKMLYLPLVKLHKRVAALAAESEVLQNIQERTAIIERLRETELTELFADLSARHVPAEQVALELERAWWQTALEHLLRTKPALLGADTNTISRLEADFRVVDDAHIGANSAKLAATLADAWRIALIDHQTEAQALRAILRRGQLSANELNMVAPNLSGVLAPVWALSPYEVAQLPGDMRFDTVMLVDAAAISLVEAVGAIRRAKQVVAFGDSVIQAPAAFNIAVTAADYKTDEREQEPAPEVPESAFTALQKVLPQLRLTHSYRAGGADLTALVNEKYYQQEIATLPWAGTFLGRSSLTYEFVRGGHGMPDHYTGAVESTDPEVERVVQLVLEHASQRPNESLMVITASRKHAVRVWQSVLSYFAQFPEYRNFLLGEHAEPFTVVTLEQATALSRDRVIFSIGYGLTAHGRVLTNFGPLSRPGGDRLLAIAMTRARRAMIIVSCFTAENLESINARYGVLQLAAVLRAEHPEPAPPSLPAQADPLLAELAERLEALGLKVALNYQGVIPLAASLNERAIAVDVDFNGSDEALRHLLRLRPAVLRRLGWHYQRVHSFDLFQEPEQTALRIAGIIGYDPQEQAAAVATAEIIAQGMELSDDTENITQVVQPLPVTSEENDDAQLLAAGIAPPQLISEPELVENIAAENTAAEDSVAEITPAPQPAPDMATASDAESVVSENAAPETTAEPDEQ